MIEITPQLQIDEAELSFLTSRSAGPGGQHANKVASRITLRFDVAGSPSLTPAQRQRLHQRLPTRITKDGVLWLHVQKHRSQRRNRQLAIERFVELLRDALAEETPRRPTRTPAAARRRRLETKRRRSRLKSERRRRWEVEG
ncbi:MAG: aminoacyl-tRNA hydrolase [Acidobacteria bacterium]|nr:MAG: aminoacyl-tRNA hydrolase [Acidobacteriota bacterium]